MGVKFLAAPRARTRIAAARDFLLGLPSGQPFLVVGWRRYAADRLAHEVAERRGALFGAHRFGFRVLVETLAAPGLAEQELSALTPARRLDLVAGLVRRAERNRALGSLSRVADSPGLASALAATFEELRLYTVAPDELEPLDPTVGALYRRYTEELAARRFADFAEALRIARNQVESGALAPHPVGLPAVFLDVRLRRSASHPLAAALCARSPDVLWTLPYGDEDTEKALRRMGASAHRDGGIPAPSRGDDALAAAQRRLFTAGTDGWRSGDDDDSVAVLAAPGANAEALEAVRVCLEAAREGVAFDRMAVLLAGRTAMQDSRFPPAFARAGIPAFFETGARRPHPSGRAFLALLDCALDDLSASRFAEYLSLGQTPPLPDGTVAAPRRWERILLEASVLEGADRWERRLAVRDEELAAIEPDGSAEGERRDLDALRRVALPIVRQLDAMRWIRRSWEEWTGPLGELAEASLSNPAEVMEHLMGGGPPAARRKPDLASVRDHLARRLTNVVTRSAGSRYGRVWVGPIEAARGLSFDVVVVPGMQEHGFPPVVRQDPLLRDALRERLGGALPLNSDRRAWQQTLLRIAVGAASRRLVVGYASLKLVEARDQAPSYYVAEVLRAGRGVAPDLETIRAEAERAGAMSPGVRAPLDSRRAVDRREFGLSRVMAALGSERDPPQQGAAAFVLREPFLARALRQDWLRGQRKWTSADGFLLRGDAETRAALEQYRPGVHAYSATGLQAFAECPYRFFLKNALRLRATERPESRAWLDPLSRGSLVHDVLFHVGQDLRQMAPLGREMLGDALESLDLRLREVAAEVSERTAPRIPAVWRDEIASIRAELREVVRRFVRERIRPVAAELSFGLSSVRGLADPASVPDPVTLPGGLRLRGSIDSVEQLAGGELRVTDYKTGKASVEAARDHRILFGGRALQPVLYALALEAMGGEKVAAGRLYYATARGRFSEVVVDTGADETRDVFGRFLETLDGAIRRGRFPAAPYREGYYAACDWCDYQSVCGPRPKFRHGRKRGDDCAVRPLQVVRNLP